MGRRGPLPQAPHLRLLRGNPGRRPPPAPAAQLPPGIPERPEWLTGEAAERWGATVPELARAGVLSVADGPALAALCQSWADYAALSAIIAERGHTCEAPDGRPMARPEVALAAKALAAARALSAEFGLTPASRSRLHVPPAEPIDEYEAFRGEATPVTRPGGCASCGADLSRAAHGPPRLYCGVACRQRAWRQRRTAGRPGG